MIKILTIDDDIHILNLLNIHLTEAGYAVLQAKNGMDALALLEKESCDAAVVDVMMPYLDGYALTKKIRQQYDIPIILLTAKDQIEDKERGFLSGTDDYLVKPFEPRELIFRLEALLRRYQKQTDDTIARLGTTTINKRSYEVQIDDRTFLLPLKEFELLYFLATHPMQVFSREQLIEQIWGLDYEGNERTVDVHVKRLRERFSKLTDDFELKTVRGVGYALEEKRG
ncbi:DNA-binding response regulator [Ammoniphilus oxalaticus]|uniref:Heme response regulator HssR n=1 Tax=Ammoniphilus oxalaticus TaxID=66863 RepID=A0A419SGU5_9BACL|nr:response regulator transcription factor [Ammoniphilus oxalaticus]RKD22955.1 DNA-binding response regulator [Ammoniphilus oxalaticus]